MKSPQLLPGHRANRNVGMRKMEEIIAHHVEHDRKAPKEDTLRGYRAGFMRGWEEAVKAMEGR